eukprot:GHVP01028127.1.p1 GENE.GHVP01028127.1~~GHVP01028127.1.p1  ORF type:complete len:111 (+),score=15.91 GHVP01028127.1:190-522(+)
MMGSTSPLEELFYDSFYQNVVLKLNLNTFFYSEAEKLANSCKYLKHVLLSSGERLDKTVMTEEMVDNLLAAVLSSDVGDTEENLKVASQMHLYKENLDAQSKSMSEFENL